MIPSMPSLCSACKPHVSASVQFFHSPRRALPPIPSHTLRTPAYACLRRIRRIQHTVQHALTPPDILHIQLHTDADKCYSVCFLLLSRGEQLCPRGQNGTCRMSILIDQLDCPAYHTSVTGCAALFRSLPTHTLPASLELELLPQPDVSHLSSCQVHTCTRSRLHDGRDVPLKGCPLRVHAVYFY